MLKKLLKYYFLLLGVFATAQVSFNAIANKTQTKVGERVQLSFIITTSDDAEISNISFPKIKGFQILGNQTGSNISYSNGKVTREFVKTIILFAQKPGKFTIHPAKIEIDGKTYESNPINITVTKSEQKDDSSPKLGNEYAKLELTLSKNEVYPNEGIIANVKLYAKSYDFLSRRSDLITPGIPGFQVKQLSKNDNRNLQQEVINGNVYVSEEIAQYQLIPTQTGELEIPEFKIRLAIPIDLFDEKIVLLKTEPKTIKIKDLPSNAPKSFNGAIGKFKLNTDIDNTDFEVNKPIVYEVEIIGEGNLSTIEFPDLNVNPKLEVYPPQRRNSYKETINGEKGKIVNKYIIVPQYGGNYTIPKFTFSFFNPETEKYETINSNSFEINVNGEGGIESNDEKTDIATSDSTKSTFIPNELHEINKRVKELIKVPNLTKGKNNSTKKWCCLLLIIPILIIVILFILIKRKANKKEIKAIEKDKTVIKSKLKTTLEKLEIAKNHQNINEFTAQSSIILNQIVALFSDEEEVIIYTESQASEILSSKVSETFLSKWEKLHKGNLLMRYSGILSNESLSELYSEYETLVNDSINKQ